MMSRKKKLVFGIVSVLFIADILVFLAVYDLSRRNFLEVDFFDVGQGDATFIQTPEGHQILIDGGPDSAILEKLGGSLPLGDRTLDLIILTHPENDHLLGLIEVLKNYEIGNILWTGIVRDTENYKEWERLIKKEQKEEKANIFIAKAGQKIYLSERNPDQYVEVLYPFESLEGKSFKDSNNTSIVNKLIFGENSFLFPGDIYKSAEKEILEKGIDVDSDVLKISHHGSKTSSAEEFIAKVSPEVAVISAGKDNKYGHPSPETLEALEKYGINILRTDINGDIKIISNGQNLTINP
ncbi:MAG: MBL fold metallo-hydrolase [Candidatus Nealsonbacteria bacterium CG_4_10_14_0_2_um_filter_40_15]|uniref:MBL fold metallo-hydrolase n=2 Tax=Candidatus Nealsoniibacteriota TaxID=1817911 RepID=A0A2M7UV12_9BACT|nr:MAG: MBL fold metallo-hydrolase [Candidatus Nealsonbacteria bacterium CG_4_10_14_0_2_um_filter_40_15]